MLKCILVCACIVFLYSCDNQRSTRENNNENTREKTTNNAVKISNANKNTIKSHKEKRKKTGTNSLLYISQLLKKYDEFNYVIAFYNASVTVDVSYIHIGKDNEKEAIEFTNKLFAQNKTDIYLYNLACEAGNKGNSELAFHILSNLWAKSTSKKLNERYLFRLIRASIGIKRHDFTIYLSEHIMENYKDVHWLYKLAHEYRADSLYRAENYYDSLHVYKELREEELWSDFSVNTWAFDEGIAKCLLQLGEYEEALKYAESAIKQTKDSKLFQFHLKRLHNKITDKIKQEGE